MLEITIVFIVFAVMAALVYNLCSVKDDEASYSIQINGNKYTGKGNNVTIQCNGDIKVDGKKIN